jgi:hypothetical protein
MEPEIITLPPPSFTRKEIKQILSSRMKESQPSFRFLMTATGVYHFQRMKDFYDYDLKEAIHFVFSMSDNSMHVSISSRLNPVHTLTPVYNNGFINPHVDLGAIIKNNGIFPSTNTCYQFDDTIEGLIPVIDQAIQDFGNEGLTYFDTRWLKLKSNVLVKRGLQIIDKWEFDRTMLRNELVVQLRKAKLVATNLRHPLYNQFKEQLLVIPDQSAEDYKEVPRLAFELMELYCNSRILS